MLKPVNIGNSVSLYMGDYRDVLPVLGRVDAGVTDPPYGIGWKPRVNHQDQPWVDDTQFDPASLLAIGNHHLFWGAQYFCRHLPHSEGWLAWVKRPVSLDFQNDNRTYATMELAWRDWGKAKFISHVWDGGMRAGASENRTFCHPSQKPVEVMDWCLRQLPAEVQIILDPFMGSGTTGISAVKAGRQFVGIEREQEYFEIACDFSRRNPIISAAAISSATLYGSGTFLAKSSNDLGNALALFAIFPALFRRFLTVRF